MTRFKRRNHDEYLATICVSLPIDCIVILDRYKKRTGDNRSVALEYMIRDWDRSVRHKEE